MSEAPIVIGSYQVLEPLGRGGMGVVYLARERDRGTLVALKTVVGMSAGILQSIRREIRTLARLRHPGIVPILAEGLHEGMPWYAMELVAGTPLRRWLRPEHQQPSTQEVSASASIATGPPTLPDGVGPAAVPAVTPAARPLLADVPTLVRRLCEPLAFLHGEGLVHRDLKPDNVLVGLDGHPVLIDFGLTTRFAAGLSRESLDMAAAAAGTIGYMAPEQIMGQLVDARADLYALGCILFELLTGQRPFLSYNSSELLAAHLFRQPVPPSQLAEGIPPELDELTLRLLAKQPCGRLGYAADVARALECLGAQPPDGLPPPPPRTYLYRAAFEGREAELAWLRQRLERLATGAGGMVLLGGESGIGKTRLALELSREARQLGAVVLADECSGTAGAPLHGLRGVLQSLGDRCREHGLAETERLLGPRGKVLATFDPALAVLPGQDAYPEPAALGPADARLRLFADLTQTLAALARTTPVLLALDDLQWADELTAAFLQHLAGRESLEAVPLLVLGTFRSEELQLETAAPLRRLLGQPLCEHLALGRLDGRSVASLVSGMLALSSAPPPFVGSLA
jgi:eukaryotic-like serine/threonine-protein kinase